MHPVLVTPPAARPIEPADLIERVETLADASVETIGALIDAAVSHLDGWSGALGRCLVEQTWSVTHHDHRRGRYSLPFSDVMTITEVSFRGEVLPEADYTLRRSWRGWYVEVHQFPALAFDPRGELTVTFTAGYGAPDKVPAAIKQAIVLMVTNLYAQTSEDGRSRSFQVDGGFTEAFNSPEQQSAQTMKAVDMLLAPFRRIAV